MKKQIAVCLLVLMMAVVTICTVSALKYSVNTGWQGPHGVCPC